MTSQENAIFVDNSFEARRYWYTQLRGWWIFEIFKCWISLKTITLHTKMYTRFENLRHKVLILGRLANRCIQKCTKFRLVTLIIKFFVKNTKWPTDVKRSIFVFGYMFVGISFSLFWPTLPPLKSLTRHFSISVITNHLLINVSSIIVV